MEGLVVVDGYLACRNLLAWCPVSHRSSCYFDLRRMCEGKKSWKLKHVNVTVVIEVNELSKSDTKIAGRVDVSPIVNRCH